MPESEKLIRNVSDTALWVAVYRAQETERSDALFRDPFAKRLMGERGPRIAAAMPFTGAQTWPFVMRTYLGDQLIMQEIAAGCTLVVNLAAGLDARPYRMKLPPDLQWVEIDLPGMIDEKEAILRNDKPVCALERMRVDLADPAARRAALQELGRRGRKTLIVCEGLLIYLSADQVSDLARDLAAQPTFQSWITEIASPGLLRMMQKTVGKPVGDAGAPFRFAPAEGPDFFVPLGWKPVDVRSMMRAAGKLKRLPFFLKLFSFLPDPKGPAGNRPWSAVCLFKRTAGP